MAQDYCRLVDNIVAEIISIPDDADIAERFTPEIIETPPAPEPPPPSAPTLDGLIAALLRRNVIALSDLTS